MNLTQLANALVDEPGIRILAGLVALDVVLGVVAAFINPGQQFRLVFLADFLRADVLGKLVPVGFIFAVTQVAGDIQIAGVDAIFATTCGAATVALGASVLNSLRDLGLLGSASDVVAGPDPTTPG